MPIPPPETLQIPREIVTAIEARYQRTAATNADPGRWVALRSILFAILSEHWGSPVTSKVANQLIVIASRKMTRQKLTIDSPGSRHKYLLAEVAEGHNFTAALEVLDYLWDKPELLPEAREQYRKSYTQGIADSKKPRRNTLQHPC